MENPCRSSYIGEIVTDGLIEYGGCLTYGELAKRQEETLKKIDAEARQKAKDNNVDITKEGFWLSGGSYVNSSGQTVTFERCWVPMGEGLSKPPPENPHRGKYPPEILMVEPGSVDLVEECPVSKVLML